MSREEILEIVNSDKKGFYIGTRLILPFKCNLIKLIADSHIFTEFVGNDHVKISQTNLNTSIYFRDTGKLSQFEGGYKCIKLIVTSEDEDLTVQDNHIKIICHILENREVELEVPGENDLFIA
ncbi:hypothetical protein OAH12_01390 [Cyclobacteriaceae bacterium]|nr:hypothetical protein [Cyclobacteriaceae bacterium]